MELYFLVYHHVFCRWCWLWFVDGVSSSDKNDVMTGKGSEDPGIVYHTIDFLLRHHVQLKISIILLYNEQIYDLLDEDAMVWLIFDCEYQILGKKWFEDSRDTVGNSYSGCHGQKDSISWRISRYADGIKSLFSYLQYSDESSERASIIFVSIDFGEYP